MTSNQDWIIRKAEIADLNEVKQIADSHKLELGFILKPVLARSIELGELLVAINGEGVVAFMQYHHRRDAQTTLHNIVVKSQYRRTGIGQKMIERLEEESSSRKQATIQLKCPENLPANNFYQHIGFEKTDVEPGKTRRLNIWRKSLAC